MDAEALKDLKRWRKYRVYQHLRDEHLRHLPYSPSVYAVGWLREVHTAAHDGEGCLQSHTHVPLNSPGPASLP